MFWSPYGRSPGLWLSEGIFADPKDACSRACSKSGLLGTNYPNQGTCRGRSLLWEALSNAFSPSQPRFSWKRSRCPRIIVWKVVAITIDFVLCTRQLRIGAGQTQQWFYSCLTGNAIEFSLLCSKMLLRVPSSFLSGIYHCDNVHTETALFWTAFVTASDHC